HKVSAKCCLQSAEHTRRRSVDTFNWRTAIQRETADTSLLWQPSGRRMLAEKVAMTMRATRRTVRSSGIFAGDKWQRKEAAAKVVTRADTDVDGGGEREDRPGG